MENSLSELQKERRRLDKRIESRLRKGEFNPALEVLFTFMDRFVQEPTREQLVECLSNVERPTVHTLEVLQNRRLFSLKSLKRSYPFLLESDKVKERYGALLNEDRLTLEELLEKYQSLGIGPERD